MSGILRFSLRVLVHSALLFPAGVHEVFAEEIPRIDAATKSEVIDTVAALMEEYYVFPEVGEKMGEHIRARDSKGEYDRYTDAKEFCAQVTADLREVCHDRRRVERIRSTS